MSAPTPLIPAPAPGAFDASDAIDAIDVTTATNATDATPAPRLAALAYHAEHSASRRLARSSACSIDAALRQVLERAAGGAAGLPAMLERRAAVQAAQQAAAATRSQLQARRLAERAALRLGAPTPWRGWFDGSAWPNPGRCGIGALLTGPQGEHIAIARAAGQGNSSEAEYRALIALLDSALARGAGQAGAALTVYGDSKVVIDDINASVAPAAALASLRAQAAARLARLPQVRLRWIPRHRNGAADALSQQARGMALGEPESAAASGRATLPASESNHGISPEADGDTPAHRHG